MALLAAIEGALGEADSVVLLVAGAHSVEAALVVEDLAGTEVEIAVEADLTRLPSWADSIATETA